MWDYSPVHCSKLKCSYSSFLFSQSILTHCNQWSKLFQDSSPFQTPLYENIRTNQQIHRKFRWIFNKNLIIKWQRILQKYLRAAKFAIMIVEAKKDFLIRLVEGVTRTVFKIKVQIGLTLQLATNNFTNLVKQINDQRIIIKEFYLSFVTPWPWPTKVPKNVLQDCSTTTSNSCTSAIFKI